MRCDIEQYALKHNKSNKGAPYNSIRYDNSKGGTQYDFSILIDFSMTQATMRMYLPMPVPQHVPFLSEKQHLGDLGP